MDGPADTGVRILGPTVEFATSLNGRQKGRIYVGSDQNVLGPDDQRSCEVEILCTGEIGARDIGSGQGRACQVGPAKVGPCKVGACEIGLAEISPSEADAGKIGRRKFGE